jgi:hypothetical protein
MGMVPINMAFNDTSLRIELKKTKTTGPGEKVKIVHACVHARSYLCSEHWLSVGWALRRTLDFEGRHRQTCAMFAKHPRSTAMLRLCPKLCLWCLGAKSSTRRPHVGSCRTRLSLCRKRLCFGKNTASALSCRRLPSPLDSRNLGHLGRRSPQGSDEYIRTARRRILCIQMAIGKSIRNSVQRTDAADDFGAITDVRNFLVDDKGGRGPVGGQSDGCHHVLRLRRRDLG